MEIPGPRSRNWRVELTQKTSTATFFGGKTAPERILVGDDSENGPGMDNVNLPLAMNRQQVEVFELLRSLSTEREKFHEWYQGGIEILGSKSPDKMAQAANSIRELCDRLPKRIANVPQPKSVVSAVKSLGPDFINVKKNFYAAGWDGNVINEPLLKMLVRLEKICDEPARTKRLGSALTSSDPQAELISKHLRDERDQAFEEIGSFFQNVTHHNHFTTEIEFRSRLELFESLLLNYLTPCTASQQKELLALIAAPATPKALARVNELISNKGANFAFFFDRLTQPDWLPLLDQAGYFEALPGPEPIDYGRIIYRHYLPLIALTRLAANVPQIVTDILIKLRLPDNPSVGNQILQCMAQVHDRACIQQLGPLVAQLAESPSRTSGVWIQELLKTWIEAEAFPEVFAILEIYLNATVELSFGKYTNDSNTWLTNQIDEKVLNQLASQHPFEIATVVFKALCRWVAWERQKYNESDIEIEAPISYWLEDFMSPSERHQGPEGTLAVRLCATAQHIYRQGDLVKIAELDQLLRSNPWQLFDRLRWQLYADFPAVSLENARSEVLQRIPILNDISYNRGGHDYEFAQLLVAHVGHHGNNFLTMTEVERFVKAVLKGPADKGTPIDSFHDDFVRKQLWPIAPLLRGEQLAAYRVLVPDDKQIDIYSYKPRRRGGQSGEVVHVAPREADNLLSMGEAQLWNFLNTWEPTMNYPTTEGWIQEDVTAMATKFAEVVEKHPEQFNSSTNWWTNITRPEILNKILERATFQIAKNTSGEKTPTPTPSEENWANWLGVVKWILAQRNGGSINDGEESQATEQTWSRHAVAGFLGKVFETDYVVPGYYFSEFQEFFKSLIGAEDPRLSGNRNSMGDWLTIAINSTRGDAVEALLNLALRQKNAGEEIEPWIFKLIKSRLELADESPAIFALLGAKLRFLIHLFEAELKESPALLFPPDRPVHRSAAVVAHIKYDQAWNRIIQIFPQFLSEAVKTLAILRNEGNDAEEKQNRRDFGSRLGTHIASYYWSGSFPADAEGEALLAQFFKMAGKSTRAMLIGQIASIWENVAADTTDKKIIARAMQIWDQRNAQIIKQIQSQNAAISDYEGELAESIDWLNCECFPFEWRFAHAKHSLALLKIAPPVYRLLKAITDFGILADRLDPMLQLLGLLLKNPSDELRWSIQFKDLAPVIIPGLASENRATQQLAIECRDLLLKMGFSEFLNL